MDEFYKTFSYNLNLTTPNKKSDETGIEKLVSFINSIKELLKCNICKNYYDLYTHSPFIIKSGHSFCKECIINNSNFIQNSKNIEEQYFIPNSLINLIIKEFQKFNLDHYINILDKKTKSYKKFDMKNGILTLDEPININYKNTESKRKISLLNIINSNNKYDLNKGSLNYDNNNNINLNSNNNIINLNSINVNIETIESKKNDKTNENKINLFKFNNIENNNDNDEDNEKEEEIKLDEKCDFGFDMISESIDTIPLFEDKSMTNMSFKKECSEILNKNNEQIQKSNEKNNSMRKDSNDNINNLLNIENNNNHF